MRLFTNGDDFFNLWRGVEVHRVRIPGEITLHNENGKIILPHCLARRKEEGNEKNRMRKGGREGGRPQSKGEREKEKQHSDAGYRRRPRSDAQILSPNKERNERKERKRRQ